MEGITLTGHKRESSHMDNASSPELRPEKCHRTDNRDVSVIPLQDLQPTASPVKLVSPPKTMDCVKLYQLFLELK